MGLSKERNTGMTVYVSNLPARSAQTCVQAVKRKCVCHWHSGQVLSVKHNNLAEHRQARKTKLNALPQQLSQTYEQEARKKSKHHLEKD